MAKSPDLALQYAAARTIGEILADASGCLSFGLLTYNLRHAS
jgi:hypothetical protein